MPPLPSISFGLSLALPQPPCSLPKSPLPLRAWGTAGLLLLCLASPHAPASGKQPRGEARAHDRPSPPPRLPARPAFSPPPRTGRRAGSSGRSELIIMVKEHADKGDGAHECQSSSALSEDNNLRHNFRLGDITWVKHTGSWWPAQVVENSCISSKPKKTAKHHVPVRLYGTCVHMYVDPWKSNMEFKMMLKRENKSAMDAFHEVVKKELSHVNSPCDSTEEAANLKAKTSSKKVRKQKGLKESPATEHMREDTKDQHSAEQHQELGYTATTGVATCKGRRTREGARQLSPTDSEDQASGKKASIEGSSYKTEKQVNSVYDEEAFKMTTTESSVGRREGLRRSARTPMKAYFDPSEDRTSPLSDTSASEDANEVVNRTPENSNQHEHDSTIDGTLASHAEIRVMVRDILFSDIIAKQHAAEMAYVDEVINGICGASELNIIGDTTPVAKGGRGIKRGGSRAEAESSNLTQRSRKGRVDQASSNGKKRAKDTSETMNHDNSSNSLRGPFDSTSRDAAMEELGQLSARQIRIMQSLALIAPSGSPFGKNGLVASTHL
uniref:PWWP domain-containing protein n=1 Tax=Oryza punctata TaxID=4537 RepID=A0A0E0LVY6_ORYPU